MRLDKAKRLIKDDCDWNDTTSSSHPIATIHAIQRLHERYGKRYLYDEIWRLPQQYGGVVKNDRYGCGKVVITFLPDPKKKKSAKKNPQKTYKRGANENTDTPSIACLICSKRFKLTVSLNDHTRMKHSISCLICSKKFKLIESLNQHLHAKHGQII